jgi:uncharacterized membrane protein
MMRRPLGSLAGMGALWCALLLWRSSADRLGCTLSAVFLVLVVLLVALSATEVAFYRRHAFLAQFLQPGSILFRLLRRKSLVVLFQLVRSVLLGLVVLISALMFEPAEWLALFVDVVLMQILLLAFSELLRAQVKTPYRLPLARHWALRANAAVLWASLVLIQFFSAHEDYTGLRWEDVALFSASRLNLGCDVLAVLARLHALGEALALWAGQNLLVGLGRPAQALMAWLVFVASFGASFLVAWAYSRVLAGVLSRPWRVWRQEPEGN